MANGFELNNNKAVELGFTDVEFQRRYVSGLAVMIAKFISSMYRHNYDYLDPRSMRIVEAILQQTNMKWEDLVALIREYEFPIFRTDPHEALYEMFVPPSDTPLDDAPKHAIVFLYLIFISLPLESLMKISDSVREA